MLCDRGDVVTAAGNTRPREEPPEPPAYEEDATSRSQGHSSAAAAPGTGDGCFASILPYVFGPSPNKCCQAMCSISEVGRPRPTLLAPVEGRSANYVMILVNYRALLNKIRLCLVCIGGIGNPHEQTVCRGAHGVAHTWTASPLTSRTSERRVLALRRRRRSPSSQIRGDRRCAIRESGSTRSWCASRDGIARILHEYY
jgi:hypothetical protein